MVLVGAFALTAAPAHGAVTTNHEHDSFPAKGAVFACIGGDLTATSGTVDEVIQTAVDARGAVHVTGTITTHDVTLQDTAGHAYTLSGASWFGLTFAEGQVVVTTNTTHFVIHNATGVCMPGCRAWSTCHRTAQGSPSTSARARRRQTEGHPRSSLGIALGGNELRPS
jgi:hypothetical protein